MILGMECICFYSSLSLCVVYVYYLESVYDYILVVLIHLVIWNDHGTVKWVTLSSSMNLETAL